MCPYEAPVVIQSLNHVQLSSSMGCGMPGFPVHHHPELAQTHVHWVGDAIHPLSSANHLVLCHPLLLLPSIFPSIRVFSKETALHIRCIRALASVLPRNIQGWFPLRLTGWISLQSKELSRVFSNTIVWRHWLFGIAFLLLSSHIHTWLLNP